MLLALTGVTGVGKSYYKYKIAEVFGFEPVSIITTRPPRKGEINNKDKVFVTHEELDQLRGEGKIAYSLQIAGNEYAYTYDDLSNEKNTVFELQYNTIDDFKRICKNLVSIYIFPNDIEMARTKVRERQIPPAAENARIKELNEHYDKVTHDERLLENFDYVVYNDYSPKSDEIILNIVKTIIDK